MFHSSMADSQDEITFIDQIDSNNQQKDVYSFSGPEMVQNHPDNKDKMKDVVKIGSSSTNNFFQASNEPVLDTIQDQVEMIVDMDDEYNDLQRQTESAFGKRRNRKKLREAMMNSESSYRNDSPMSSFDKR